MVSGIGGGKNDRGGGTKKFLELLDQRIAEEELLIQEAKEKGYWKMGLDANNDLFIAIQKKYKKLIDKLKSEVDGEPKDV